MGLRWTPSVYAPWRGLVAVGLPAGSLGARWGPGVPREDSGWPREVPGGLRELRRIFLWSWGRMLNRLGLRALAQSGRRGPRGFREAPRGPGGPPGAEEDFSAELG